MKRLAWLSLVAISASCSYADNIAVKLSVDQKTYGPGDTIQFHITYRNLANHKVRFIPDTVIYPSDLFAVTQANSDEPIKAKHYGFLSVDFEGQAKNIKTLAPGGECADTVTARILKQLPEYFNDGSTGLFLVFPASAFHLPSAGEYVLTAVYRAAKDEPARFHAKSGPPVWVGQVRSNPITITFRY